MTAPEFLHDDDDEHRLPLRPAGTRTESHLHLRQPTHIEHQQFYGPLYKLAVELYGSGPGKGPANALDQLAKIQKLHSALDALTCILLADSVEQVNESFADMIATTNAHSEAEEREARENAAYYGVDRGSDQLITSNFVAEAAIVLRETPQKVAKRMFHAKGLRHLCPDTLSALAAGQITAKAAHDIVKFAQDLSPEQIARMEQQLLPVAQTAQDDVVYQRARRFHDRNNPESATQRQKKTDAARKVTQWDSGNGLGCLKYEGPMPVVKSIMNTLQFFASQQQSPEDQRTADQLMADIFADALITGWPGVSGTPLKPRLSIMIPAVEMLANPERGLADLEGYGPIPIGVAVELAKDAPSFQRVLTDPWTGAAIDVEPRRYRTSKGLKDLLRHRDQHCGFPGCRRAADTSEIDHIEAFAHGGQTTRDNTQLLCKRHQMFKHALGWKVISRPDGSRSWVSPHGVHTIIVPESMEQIDGMDHVHDHCPQRPESIPAPQIKLTAKLRQVLGLPKNYDPDRGLVT